MFWKCDAKELQRISLASLKVLAAFDPRLPTFVQVLHHHLGTRRL